MQVAYVLFVQKAIVYQQVNADSSIIRPAVIEGEGVYCGV